MFHTVPLQTYAPVNVNKTISATEFYTHVTNRTFRQDVII